MSDPLGSDRHVSPLVRSSTHAPSPAHQSAQTNHPSSPPQQETEAEHQIAVLQNRSHGPARTQTQPSGTSSTSETPSAAAHSASSPPKKSPTSPLKSVKRRRPEAPPQLSERDDIFATHYLAADSGASTPVLSSARLTKTEAVNQDVAASVPLPGPISSGTELSSSSLSSQSDTSQKMHMAPEQAPYSTSPAPPLLRAGAKEFADEITSSSRLGTPVEEEDKEDWDRLKEKDRSRPTGRRHRSDEQIQATLANEDALGQVRSRKASHYLGLFKENAKEKRQHRKSRDRAKEVYGIADEEQDNDGELENRQEKGGGETHNEKSGSDGTSVTNADAIRPRFVQTAPIDPIAVVSPISDHGDAVQAPGGNVEWFSEGGDKSGAYPIRLLEEIRAHPVAQKHSKDKHRDSSPSEALSRAKIQAVSSAINRKADGGLGKALILPQEAEAEAEDSDKEHISAATYFPHQAASPDDIQGHEKSGETFEALGDPAISPLTQPSVLPRPDEVVKDPQQGSKSSGSKSTERDIVKSPEKAIKEELFTSPRRVNTGLSTVSENEYESLDDDPETEIDELADVDHTPTNTPRVRPVRVKKPTRRPRSPLGAVELKPYKHQVGGHTKVFSFSKQAICKELNNKENQFYEVIERRHPELLDFMPRYLGVLNVTYTKAKRKQQPSPNGKSNTEASNGVSGASTEEKHAEAKEPQERVISKSKNFSQPEETVARVEYANNMHIIPINLFPNSPGLNGVRPQTANGAIDSAAATGLHGSSHDTNGVTGEDEGQESLTIRPEIANNPSWGATTVNTEMKEKILREVFSPSNVQIRHHRRVRRPLTDESFDNPPLSRFESARRSHPPNKDALLSAALLNSASDLTPLSSSLDAYRGGSAPAPSFIDPRERTSVDDNTLEEANMTESGPSADRHISRRRSDQGLQRLQRDIDTGERSELNYFEDEVLKTKDEPMFDMEDRQKARRASRTSDRFIDNKAPTTPTRPADTNGVLVPNGLHSPREANRQLTMSPQFPAVPFPAPVNPLQAQQITDERVRHFLLLEDLTANMSKPCVLDLKMGTRQYGIEANAKKRSSQSKKCSMTTSRQLGVRLCGMQVWNVKKQEYVFEDKYAGRDLKAGKDFQAALRRFLYDGVSSKSVTRHIPVLLDKLARLEQIVSQLPRYRFYASSLLLIYDGADLPSQKGMERGGKVDAETVDGADTGAGEKSKATVATSNIDVRLVDFANCVTSQTKRLADAPSPPAHPNMPDRGYVKGLRSLRSYFQRIWMEINTEEAGSWVERGEGEAMAIAQKGAGNADQPEGWREAGEAQEDASEYSS